MLAGSRALGKDITGARPFVGMARARPDAGKIATDLTLPGGRLAALAQSATDPPPTRVSPLTRKSERSPMKPLVFILPATSMALLGGAMLLSQILSQPEPSPRPAPVETTVLQ